MKILIVIISLLISTMPVFSALVDKPSDLKIGAFAELTTEGKPVTGFLKYMGQHKGVTFCALSSGYWICGSVRGFSTLYENRRQIQFGTLLAHARWQGI